MKKLFVILLAVVIALPVSSQIKFGLKAGVSTTNITMGDAKSVVSGGTTYTLKKLEESKYGIHAGAFLRLGIKKLYIQPELLFATRSNGYTLSKVNSLTDSIQVKQNFSKVDIPVMVGVKFGPIRLNAGPVGSFTINTPKDLISDPDFKTLYSKMSIGYQAGIGLDLIKKLTIDLRFEGSLKKYQNQIESKTGTKLNLDDRPNAFLMSVGYMF